VAVILDKLLELVIILAEKYSALEKAKSNYQKINQLNGRKNSKVLEAKNKQSRLVRQCQDIEQKIAIEVIPDKFMSRKNLGIKKEYRRAKKQLHISYGSPKPLSKNHGHCVINIPSGEICYHRPLDGSHGRHNYLSQQ
jgi:hypothetical protein